MNLQALSPDELRALETAWDTTITASFRHRNEVRDELAARLNQPVEDLFPREPHRSNRQRAWVDSDRRLHQAQARIVELEEQLALHGVTA